MIFDLTTAPFIALGAILFGLDKSFAPGAGMLAVALLAGIMPTKTASGITLLMAIAADWCAIWAYRGNASRSTLIRLFPFVAAGIVCGAFFLFVADDAILKRTIGIILAIFVGAYFINLARKHASGNKQAPTEDAPATPLVLPKRILCGSLAGFTSMVANVGGPVTSIYFLSEGLPVMIFLGTTAWFYLIVNLVKIPFSIGLGMITLTALQSMIWTIPLTLVTVLIGRQLARRVSQGAFSTLIYVLSTAAVIKLLI